jgi:hypothetical protein
MQLEMDRVKCSQELLMERSLASLDRVVRGGFAGGGRL